MYDEGAEKVNTNLNHLDSILVFKLRSGDKHCSTRERKEYVKQLKSQRRGMRSRLN